MRRELLALLSPICSALEASNCVAFADASSLDVLAAGGYSLETLLAIVDSSDEVICDFSPFENDPETLPFKGSYVHLELKPDGRLVTA